MNISVFFQVILLLALSALLLGAAQSPSGRKGKKERKERPANKGSHRKSRKVSLNFDSAVEFQPDIYQMHPSQSISPWTYEVSNDESRMPRHIFEAKCELTGCINKDGDEDIGLESKPIFYQIMVLRKIKSRNEKTYSFQLEKYTTSVGCTCVFPNILSHK
ncbi:interleukin 17a/f3 [Silurus meridionalis]|uniref:Interleukin-17F n=1 Tax=Silurus meridionalis TaxID=175797 RepID=A0A8T0AH91_SILME|nr:interleukin 17a/f3 [Silurus meridionalis]KAF7690086.1 hypothetical protein HF521_011890 [Silurus meridionalis]